MARHQLCIIIIIIIIIAKMITIHIIFPSHNHVALRRVTC